MRMNCTAESHSADILRGILKDGGEGIMMRKPLSLYERGRSLSLVKLKVALHLEQLALIFNRLLEQIKKLLSLKLMPTLSRSKCNSIFAR